jgi:hypothetical protein
LMFALVAVKGFIWVMANGLNPPPPPFCGMGKGNVVVHSERKQKDKMGRNKGGKAKGKVYLK